MERGGKCTACESAVLADWEWDLLTVPNSAGFVETEVNDPTEFPITITAYRGDKTTKVRGVREDSITATTDREGNINLSFEMVNRPNAIGYLPCIDWYSTELDT